MTKCRQEPVPVCETVPKQQCAPVTTQQCQSVSNVITKYDENHILSCTLTFISFKEEYRAEM